MNEQLDKLIIKIFFALFLCLVLIIYKYAHRIFYPSTKEQMTKKFNPTINTADSIHFFSRIIGISILFSELNIFLDTGIFYAIVDLLILSTVSFTLYLLSIYIMDSITLYNFEYNDEVLKRKNVSYALICFSHGIGMAFLNKTIINVADHSITMLFLLWSFSMVVVGSCAKTYKWLSKLSFNKLIIQKDYSIAFSYIGFFLGATVIVQSSFNHEIRTITGFTAQVLIHIITALLAFPLFKKGIHLAFKIKIDTSEEIADVHNRGHLGYGVYEGAIFFTTCYLTSIIINHIYFGGFYPLIE